MRRFVLAIVCMLLGLSAAAAAAEFTTKQGKVKEFHTSPKGDVDRIVLSDGAEIRFPPHIGDRVKSAVSVGDEITAKVEKHVTPKGDEHLRASTITNVKTGTQVDCTASPPEKKDEKG